MKNMRQTIKKLQKALLNKGKIYKISTYQFYSEEQSRLITGYRVTEKRPYIKKDGSLSEKDFELVNTCSEAEVLKWFSQQWKEEREQGDKKAG